VLLPTHTVVFPAIAVGIVLTVKGIVETQPALVVYNIFAVPPDTPVISPVVTFAIATVVLLLLHVPPNIALLSVIVVPWHTVVVPVIGATGFTVTVVVAIQPADVVYTIAVVPADTPDTMPDDNPTVATPGVPELHVPPVGTSLRVVVLPWHTVVFPVIADGSVLTVTVVEALHPARVVYFTIVLPVDMPYTTPAVTSTVATELLLLLHVPPVGESLSVVVLPAQIIVLPVTGTIAFTVTVVVATQPAAVVKVIGAIPADTPDTTPDPATTVAIPVAPEFHVPLPAASLSVVVAD
jgi:hypothetical protein